MKNKKRLQIIEINKMDDIDKIELRIWGQLDLLKMLMSDIKSNKINRTLSVEDYYELYLEPLYKEVKSNLTYN